ncbi:hypothetical protein OESDEN_11428 [Oesophagostomum dentatum]|uniref:Spore coat protein T domain protein n=1 Tax=Oesophagostomum dentatum TaxID=61180 RepID=A0A0B1SZ32_OESDE|nr:hypothetical protein OESDEN_11428 [Oesophagostomum dentatum]
MMFAFVALALLGAVMAMPHHPHYQSGYGYPPRPYQYPGYPGYYPIMGHNNEPLSNVKPGRHHGAFRDIFSGPHIRYDVPMYPGYPIGGWPYPMPPYEPWLSNPFYTEGHRRHHKRHDSRSDEDNRDRHDSRGHDDSRDKHDDDCGRNGKDDC